MPVQQTIRTDLYGRVANSARVRCINRLIRDHFALPADGRVSVADIGCGSGETLGCIREHLLRHFGIPPEKTAWHGFDISAEAVAQARERGFAAECADIAVPLPDTRHHGRFDLVVLSEVIEHVVDTDTVVKNIHAMLKPEGLLVLTTPNLAAWYNRIILLFGFQPHCMEVSYEPRRFGNRFVAKLLGEDPDAYQVAGHLRLFTYRALREFLVHHGFRLCARRGIATHEDALSRLIAALFPGLAGDVALAARKALPAAGAPG